METVSAFFGQSDPDTVFSIPKAIVDTVLIGMLSTLGQESFELGENFKFSSAAGNYTIVVKNVKAFELVVGQISTGLSFREVVRSIEAMKRQGLIPFVRCVSEKYVSKCVQSLTALSLHKLSDAVQGSWCYSVAFDGATNRGNSYIDVRIRLYLQGGIHNFHVLAIPFEERHTGINMFRAVSDLMGAVVGEQWSKRMIGVATDGAANMVGHHSGAVTRLERLALPGFFRIWCGAHQLDLVVQGVMAKSMKACFYEPLTRLISYLRRQYNLRA